ncbi:hypothetical protein e1012e08.tmp0011 [Eimeria tenella]|uniref:Uncharacterized protein n=1 Tax=Eimeria tenella TaxID=5802 RepID=C8TDJ6_EIMTE|nr:hypothetical protein e1012e08.tmp0011 [Eimeria tenella]
MASFYTDNHGNSMANTREEATSFGGVQFIGYKINPLPNGVLVIHSNRTGRRGCACQIKTKPTFEWGLLLGPRWITQISDLSAFDVRLLAYRGSDEHVNQQLISPHSTATLRGRNNSHCTFLECAPSSHLESKIGLREYLSHDAPGPGHASLSPMSTQCASDPFASFPVTRTSLSSFPMSHTYSLQTAHPLMSRKKLLADYLSLCYTLI